VRAACAAISLASHNTSSTREDPGTSSTRAYAHQIRTREAQKEDVIGRIFIVLRISAESGYSFVDWQRLQSTLAAHGA
jgi:hypothetical protein